jgi:hypothetical protein
MALRVQDQEVSEEITALEQTLHVRISTEAIREAGRRQRNLIDVLGPVCQQAREELWEMMDPDLRAKWRRQQELEHRRQDAVSAMAAAKRDGRLSEAKTLRTWLSATAPSHFALKAEVDPRVHQFEEAIAQLWPTVTADHVIRAARHDEIMVSLQL